jgi:hypothetical protein
MRVAMEWEAVAGSVRVYVQFLYRPRSKSGPK